MLNTPTRKVKKIDIVTALWLFYTCLVQSSIFPYFHSEKYFMLLYDLINFVIAQEARVYHLGTSPNQLGNRCLAFGGPMNQDSECQMDEGRPRRRGGETSCFRFIRNLLALERRPGWKDENGTQGLTWKASLNSKRMRGGWRVEGRRRLNNGI